MTYQEAILAALAASGRSAREVSLAALGHESAVRSLNRDLDLRGSTIQALCKELGLEFYVGPPRGAGKPGAQIPEAHVEAVSPPSPSNLVPQTQVQRPLTTFSSRMALPVREWRRCSSEGHLSKPRENSTAPAPVDLFDDKAFYGQMRDESMLPEGVPGHGFYCLISPNTQLDVDERVWLRNCRGQEVIGRLVEADSKAYCLRRWGPPDDQGQQARIDERWMRADVADAGVVLAVYADRPSVKHAPFRVPDVAGPEGRRFMRVPVADQQFESMVAAQVEHYEQLNRYRRDRFVAEIAKVLSVGDGAENPHVPPTGEK